MITAGITQYGVQFNRLIARKVHSSLKAKGFINIHLMVFNGRWIAKVDVPGGIGNASKNIQIKN